MNAPILSLRNLKKSFAETEIIRGVELNIFPGERHAIIGPNGAGKSTLFHLISGNLKPTSGEIIFNSLQIEGLTPQEINRRGLARSFQITNIFPKLSVFENLRLAVMQRHGLQYTFWRILSKVPLIGQETDQLLERVRLQARANTLAGELSYSEQRALEIAITLACDPLLILLDEPMAGMSHEETDYMVDLIRELTTDRTLIIVEHDMDVVFSLSDRISVLVYGQVLATGTPEQISNDAKVRKAYLGEKVGA
jgi:branched-chain amino acid transport system ATP-binding protein